MQHKEADNQKQTALSSIAKAWGDEKKQERWLKWKHDVIEQTEKLILDNIPFNDLYKFIANARHEIAIELDQDGQHALGIPRHEYSYPMTGITTYSRYCDFYPYLVSRFDAIPEKQR